MTSARPRAPEAPLYRQFTTKAEIDVQYDPGQRVADEGAYLQRYIERAAHARSHLTCLLDVSYGPSREETLDIFPAAHPGAPVFVFLHGGYWRALSSKEFSGVALGLQPLGITTVVVNYALCPSVTLDEVTRQARASVAWTLRHIDAHGGDASRVAVGGHSAGGHLTAMCLATDWNREYGLAADPLAAAVPVSGIFDIEPLRHSYLQPAIRLDEGLVARNSPLFHVRSSHTPVLVTYGGDESEEFARQAASFHAAWRAIGNTSTLSAQPGCNHYTAIEGFEHAESPLCRWLARTLDAEA